MKLIELKIKGFFIVKPNIFTDRRGSFRRHFCKKTLLKYGINFSAVQGNISESLKRGTLRGFHYKKNPSKELKFLSCLTGSLYHIAIDLRKNSKTFKKTITTVLNSSKKESLIIPASCANAFLTLENNTTVHYYMGDYFEEKKYAGIRYNDPSFKIKWPFKPKVINQRDKNYPNFIGKKL